MTTLILLFCLKFQVSDSIKCDSDTVFADSLCRKAHRGNRSSAGGGEGEAGCVVALQQGGLLRLPE